MLQPAGGTGGEQLGDDSDDGLSAGSGGPPVAELDAGEPPGTTGDSGPTGREDAGMFPGTGGAGGLTGAAGDATGGATVPKEGEAYGPCRADGSCDLPMFCMFGADRYCAPLCNGNGPLSCPPQPDGSLAFCVRNVCTRL